MVGHTQGDCSISVPLPVGSRVILSQEYDVDDCGSYVCKPFYEATVLEHNPKTLHIEMSDGTHRAELIEKINTADGVEVIRDW